MTTSFTLPTREPLSAKTVFFSPKPETAVLATLEKIVGKTPTDQIRALIPVAEDDSATGDDTESSSRRH